MLPRGTSSRISAWLVVALCFLTLAFVFSARAALGLVMPVWVRELGWTKTFNSGAAAAAQIVMACVAPVAGRLVDRNGPRSVLAIGLVAVGLGAVIVGFSSSQASFVVGFSLVSAIGFGAVGAHVVSTGVARLFDAFGVVDYSTVPVTASLVASHLGVERVGLAIGLISAGHAVDGSLGAFLGGYLFDATASYGLVWWSGVWLAVVAAVLVLPLGDVDASRRSRDSEWRHHRGPSRPRHAVGEETGSRTTSSAIGWRWRFPHSMVHVIGPS